MNEIEMAIEEALNKYLNDNPRSFNLRFFAGMNGYDIKDVVAVCQTSENIEAFQRIPASRTIVLATAAKPKPKPVVKASYGKEPTAYELDRQKILDGIEEMKRNDESIQSWADRNASRFYSGKAENVISLIRKYATKEFWESHYEYKRDPNGVDWDERYEDIQSFVADGGTVEEWCDENNLAFSTVRAHLTNEQWSKVYVPKRRKIDWVAVMKLWDWNRGIGKNCEELGLNQSNVIKFFQSEKFTQDFPEHAGKYKPRKYVRKPKEPKPLLLLTYEPRKEEVAVKVDGPIYQEVEVPIEPVIEPEEEEEDFSNIALTFLEEVEAHGLDNVSIIDFCKSVDEPITVENLEKGLEFPKMTNTSLRFFFDFRMKLLQEENEILRRKLRAVGDASKELDLGGRPVNDPRLQKALNKLQSCRESCKINF